MENTLTHQLYESPQLEIIESQAENVLCVSGDLDIMPGIFW